MDLVTDLSSQAVSFISILQDICQSRPEIKKDNNNPNYFLKIANELKPVIRKVCSYDRRQNISEITYISDGEDFTDESLEYFMDTSIALIEWYLKHHKLAERFLDERSIGKLGLDSSLYEWRQGIKYILYTQPLEREPLVNIIHYMPLQIILCLGGGALSVEDQRLYQTWHPEYKLNTATRHDVAKSEEWWDNEYEDKKRTDFASELLASNEELRLQLIGENIPVPFETIFNDELAEILEVRKLRIGDDDDRRTEFEKHLFKEPKSNPADQFSDDEDNDPLNRAKAMRLYGLAFWAAAFARPHLTLAYCRNLRKRTC